MNKDEEGEGREKKKLQKLKVVYDCVTHHMAKAGIHWSCMCHFADYNYSTFSKHMTGI